MLTTKVSSFDAIISKYITIAIDYLSVQCATPFQTRATTPMITSSSRTCITCQATNHPSRRDAFARLTASLLLGTTLTQNPFPAFADDDEKLLCSAECAANLAQSEKVTTPSGLRFHDIVIGTGSSPPVGFQVVVNYVAMTPEGRVFDSSLQRGAPYDIRVGAGQVIAGLDEGLRTMKSGGIRRLYIPGSLAFPNGLPAGPGRPRVPPSSPVVFDVQLLYVPGVDDE